MKAYIVSLLVSCVMFMFTTIVLAENRHSHRIQGPFDSGPQVTKACIRCHQQQADELLDNEHWTWSVKQSLNGHDGHVEIGKKRSINNFCIAVPSNWPRCTSCHAGYGWEDASFDFTNRMNIDCLVCHDTTGTYRKDPDGAGMPATEVDLLKVAQNVGRSSRKTCGSCHFYGGGADHVKHGDLDTSLINPKRSYDVHMGTDGPNATCQFCHQTTNHEIPGQAMSVSVGAGNRVECGGCHGRTPHDSTVVNDHSKSVACQTCHIPFFAKDKPTLTWWDWSKAGEERKPTIDRYNMETYSKKKGEFRWGKNLIPEYAWYNGQSERHALGDKFNPEAILYLTKPMGSLKDRDAKIYPFKIMQGKQPYDSENHYLVVPKLFGGYWTHFDWNRAISEGMKAAGLLYSGRYGFVQTRMYWQISHMVVPKEQALKCKDCHAKTGRLDWSALGYEDDPRLIGGRIQK